MATGTRRGATTRARVTAVRDGAARARDDRLAVEEPLEIRAAGPGEEPVPVAVTMRTPGHDFDLAAGFLVTEGVTTPHGIRRVAYCTRATGEDQLYNVVTVSLAHAVPPGAERRVFAGSSCGVCGKATLDAVEVTCPPVADGPPVTPGDLIGMPATLRAAQDGFDRTGGVHAAALFTPGGELLEVREDVGRHNAVDKVVGAAALAGGLPLTGRVMVVSGRLGFEIVQKAAVAGCGIVAAVSAPTSLAVDAAERLGVTAVGFLRDGGFNVYTHPHRVETGA